MSPLLTDILSIPFAACCKISHHLLLRLLCHHPAHFRYLLRHVRPRPHSVVIDSVLCCSHRRVSEPKTTTSNLPSTPAKDQTFGHHDDTPDDQPCDAPHIVSSSVAARHGLIPEQGPDLIGGTLLMDSDSHTIRERPHRGLAAAFLLLTSAVFWVPDPQLHSSAALW